MCLLFCPFGVKLASIQALAQNYGFASILPSYLNAANLRFCFYLAFYFTFGFASISCLLLVRSQPSISPSVGEIKDKEGCLRPDRKGWLRPDKEDVAC
jgi:hypothetical protein